MRYSQIRSMDVSNGIGIGVAVFTQGCPIRCFNCFNPETWDYDKGDEWTDTEEGFVIKLMSSEHIVRLSILGGEPLIDRNIVPLTKLLTRVHNTYPNKSIWLYSGQCLEKMKETCQGVLTLVDILIDGPYVDARKDYKLHWRGSSNQRIIDMQKTFANMKKRNAHTFIPQDIVLREDLY